MVVMAIQKLMGAALKVPLFDGLQPRQMNEIVQRAERVIYRPGEALIRQGEIGDAAVLLITGRATCILSLAASSRYELFDSGSLIGEMAMLIKTEHVSTVIADEEIRALRFPRTMIEMLMAQDPDIADHFVRRIASRLNGLAAEMRAFEAQLTETATNEVLTPVPQPLATMPVPTPRLSSGIESLSEAVFGASVAVSVH